MIASMPNDGNIGPERKVVWDDWPFWKVKGAEVGDGSSCRVAISVCDKGIIKRDRRWCGSDDVVNERVGAGTGSELELLH